MVQMPPRIAALPKTENGYPVPFFVIVKNGVPDLRVLDPRKQQRCFKQNLCGICGQGLDYWVAFVSGPQARSFRVSADPPMHEECAEYALKVCPYLVRPSAKRAKEYSVEVNLTDPHFLSDRPEKMALIIARRDSVKFGLANGSLMFSYQTPKRTRWWQDGQELPEESK